MQSFSPIIIKHYIPFEFSKEAVDFHMSPKKIVPQKDDNPLQNIKLKLLKK